LQLKKFFPQPKPSSSHRKRNLLIFIIIQDYKIKLHQTQAEHGKFSSIFESLL